MRSRTSRGVPEWSGGEELYIGSPVSATWKVSGVTGIVPGPPEGSRGSIGWGHLSRRAPWAEVGKGSRPWWAGAPTLGLPLHLGLETLGVGGAPLGLGGTPPPWPLPPWRLHLLGPAPPLGVLYIVRGREGSRTLAPGASLSLLWHLSLSLSLAKLCRDHRCFHHHAVVLLDLYQPLLPPCWIKLEETSSQPYVC